LRGLDHIRISLKHALAAFAFTQLRSLTIPCTTQFRNGHSLVELSDRTKDLPDQNRGGSFINKRVGTISGNPGAMTGLSGALANLGYRVSDQTVGNVLRRHGIAPAPERKRTTTWAEFIQTHLALLAGTDFFTVEVLTWRGVVTYYVLFFIHLESRRVDIAGITDHPNGQWMQQMARNATMAGLGALRHCRYLLHDRDAKYSAAFRTIIETGHVRTLSLPAA
jgi:hypothetical protein